MLTFLLGISLTFNVLSILVFAFIYHYRENFLLLSKEERVVLSKEKSDWTSFWKS